MVDMHEQQDIEIQLPSTDEQVAALARVDDRHLQITEALDWLKQGKTGDELEAINFVEHQMQQYRNDLESAYVLIGATKGVAEKFQEQRNEAVASLETLEEALDTIDTSDPRIARVYEIVEENVVDMINSGWWDDSESLEPEEQYEVALENAASTILTLTNTVYSPENFDRAKKVAYAFFSSQYGEHSDFATDDPDVRDAFRLLMEKKLAADQGGEG